MSTMHKNVCAENTKFRKGKFMKKLIAILVAVCMCFSLCMILTACSNQANDKESDKESDKETNQVSHEHVYKTEWEYDDTYHWHACEGEDCTAVSDKAEHTWDDGVITTEATAEADGVKIFTCTVCGKTKTETVGYVPDEEDKSGYSVFYTGVGDDVIYLVQQNKDGLPVAVYFDDAIYGERESYDDRELKFSIAYNDDGLISSITREGYRYYEFTYDESSRYGYGVEYRADAKIKVETGRSIAILYSENKNIAQINAYEATGALTQYSFNESGQLVRIIEDYEVATYAYDEYGRMIRCTVFNLSRDSSSVMEFSYSGSDTLPTTYKYIRENKLEYDANLTYDADGHVLTAKLSFYDEDGVPEYIQECISRYDDSGRLIAYDSEYVRVEEYEIKTYTELTYDDGGKLIKAVDFNKDGDNKLIDQTEQYEYDERGNCIREIRKYYGTDGQIETEDHVTFTYNADNMCTSEIDGNGYGYRYTYDDNGLMISEVYVYEGEERTPYTYQWIFDENDRLIKQTEIYNDLIDFSLNYKKYSYDADGRLISYSDSDRNRDYTFTRDLYARITEIAEAVSDKQGFVQRSTTYTYSESGELIAASLFKWDSGIGEYVTVVYNYTEIGVE